MSRLLADASLHQQTDGLTTGSSALCQAEQVNWHRWRGRGILLTARCSRENVCSGCHPRVCQPWPVPALSSVAQRCAKGRGGSGRGAWAPLVRCCLSGSQLCVLISHHTFICSPAAVLPAHSSSVLAVPALVSFAPSHLFPPRSPPASPSISRLSCPTSLTPRTIRLPQCICRQQDGQPGWCFSRYCGYPGPTVAPRGLWGLPSWGIWCAPGFLRAHSFPCHGGERPQHVPPPAAMSSHGAGAGATGGAAEAWWLGGDTVRLPPAAVSWSHLHLHCAWGRVECHIYTGAASG